MNNNWEFDYSELYNNNNPGRNAQNTTAPEGGIALAGRARPRRNARNGCGRRAGAAPCGTEKTRLGQARRRGSGRRGVLRRRGLRRRISGLHLRQGRLHRPRHLSGARGLVRHRQRRGGTANTADALSVTEIASKVGPSVVEVTTEAVTTNAFFGQYVQSGAAAASSSPRTATSSRTTMW